MTSVEETIKKLTKKVDELTNTISNNNYNDCTTNKIDSIKSKFNTKSILYYSIAPIIILIFLFMIKPKFIMKKDIKNSTKKFDYVKILTITFVLSCLIYGFIYFKLYKKLFSR